MTNRHPHSRGALLTLPGIILILCICTPAMAATITVGPDGDYTGIQAAIDNATAGDTILVTAGTYAEAIDVNKTLTIRGVNGTPAVGKADAYASVRITADDIILENFRITTGKRWDVWVGGNNLSLYTLNMTGHDPAYTGDPVILAGDVAGLLVDGCTLETSGAMGILTNDVPECVLRDSAVIVRNDEEREAGIGFWAKYNETSSFGPQITNTTFIGGSIRILCMGSYVHGITVADNTVRNSECEGILVIGHVKDELPYPTTNVTIVGNHVSGSESLNANIMIEYCADGRFEDNLVEDSYEGADGIYLQYLDNFLIQGNTVQNATVDATKGMCAVNLEVVTNSVISGNTVTNVDPYGFWYAPGPNFLPNLTFDTTNTADGRPVRYYEAANGVSLNGEEIAMLLALSSSDIQVTDCTIANAGLGAGIYGCSDLTITGNTFRETNNGMMLIDSSDSVIRENTFNESFFAMGVGDNDNTLITQNTFSGYMDSGMVIHCGDPDGVTISENLFEGSMIGSDQGVAGMDATAYGIDLVNNTFTGNSRGILLGLSSGLTFRDNCILDNRVGVNLLGACNNVFLNNTIINTEDNFVGIILNNAEAPGSGPCSDNLFSNNYIESDVPLYAFYLTGSQAEEPYEFGPLWGPEIVPPALAEPEAKFHNDWNVTKTAGTNIVGGPFLGGNYWATPNGTGWSQVTPDRGDGFCTEPFAYNENNTDYLPLHLYVDPTPVANFTFSPATGDLPLTVTFTDTSTGNITNWSWSFGDGATSELQHPEHIYETAGLYSVTLNVTGPAGESELTRPDAISVHPYGDGDDDSRSAPAVATGTGSLYTNSRGLVLQELMVFAGDSTGELTVPSGSVALDGEGDPLTGVTIAPSELPSDGAGGQFAFAGYAYTCSPDGATFSPAADLVFTFTEAQWADLMADGRPLVVTYYNEETGVYEALLTTVDAATRTVTAEVTHFSSFILMYRSAVVEDTPVATSAPTAVSPTTVSPTATVQETPETPATSEMTPTPGEATPFPVTGALGALLVFAVCACAGRRR
ncbi:NosD domain-containing protein [Methanogenium organophilum]|uniref:Right-handed parallel beta-helix repeat-containing protein n=1 Tax=Methanogenium organophilum TaxID=2199 RepID=A0A9X9T8V1_METOG|nr:NosD domain-containing protein [Methanogenium organophilum]WAI01811.1 right-handed parallel beta-helix repeat-containing protein [Methanogenium organophilum]